MFPFSFIIVHYSTIEISSIGGCLIVISSTFLLTVIKIWGGSKNELAEREADGETERLLEELGDKPSSGLGLAEAEIELLGLRLADGDSEADMLADGEREELGDSEPDIEADGEREELGETEVEGDRLADGESEALGLCDRLAEELGETEALGLTEADGLLLTEEEGLSEALGETEAEGDEPLGV